MPTSCPRPFSTGLPELPPRGVVRGQETDRDRTVYVPASILFRPVQVAQSLRNVVVVNIRIVLLHNAVDRRERFVIDGVYRTVALDSPVSDTQRQVGVGKEGAVGLHLHQPFHVEAVECVDFGVEALVCPVHFRIVERVESLGQQQGRIVLQCSGLCSRIGRSERLVLFDRRKVALLEQFVYVPVDTSRFLYRFEEIGRASIRPEHF